MGKNADSFGIARCYWIHRGEKCKLRISPFSIINLNFFPYHIQVKQFQDLNAVRWQSVIQWKIYFALENTSWVLENLDFTYFQCFRYGFSKIKSVCVMCRIVVQFFNQSFNCAYFNVWFL